MDLEPFGYGNRWFDRLEAWRRSGTVIAVAFGIIMLVVVTVLNWIGV